MLTRCFVTSQSVTNCVSELGQSIEEIVLPGTTLSRRNAMCAANTGNVDVVSGSKTQTQGMSRNLSRMLRTCPLFNHPRHHALLLRAIRFAATHKRLLIWYRAVDVPYKGIDESLEGEGLQKRRETWLKYPDNKTAGIMGLLPLVRGMPMRCTETTDRGRQLFKHTRCTLEGFELDPIDAQLVDTCTETEYVLTLPPKALLVRREMQEFESDSANKADVVKIDIIHRSWCPDAANKVQVNRRGFQVVPNFAGTIHSFVGASLDAAMLDCLHFSQTPRKDDQLKAYLGISRVRTAEGLLIVQPYHPMLFKQGSLPGPELIMKFWRGEAQNHELPQMWQDMEAAAQKLKKRLDEMQWPCGSCQRLLKPTL